MINSLKSAVDHSPSTLQVGHVLADVVSKHHGQGKTPTISSTLQMGHALADMVRAITVISLSM